MNKKTLFGICILIMIMLIPSAISVGTCSLDKFKYNPLEITTMACGCTHPNEENIDGFIVFRNSSEVILQNSSVNSGSCRVDAFGISHLFPAAQDYLGNVTFETTDTNWADASDVINDSFNVSGAGVNDCLITFINETKTPNLGEDAASKIAVSDAITGNPLVHVACILEITDINNIPIARNPPLLNQYVFSTEAGHTLFAGDLQSNNLKVGTTYSRDFHCFCANDSELGTTCFDQVTGARPSFKSCSLTTLLTTGGKDLRKVDSENIGGASIALIIFLLCITGTIFFFPFLMDYLGKSFAKSEYVNIVIRRSCFLLGTYLMQLNVAMMLSIVMNSGLTVSNNITFYLWFFGMAGYLYMMYLALITIIDVLSMIADKKHKDRFGDNNE